MKRDDGSTPELDNPATWIGDFWQIGHAGRVARVLTAWILSAWGWLYTVWGLGLIFFGPAAVLLAVAGMDPKSRRAVAFLSLPTALGLCLSLFTMFSAPLLKPSATRTLGEAAITTGIVALLECLCLHRRVQSRPS